MSAAHSNVAIFVPHIGCPNQCSFCNQRYITGKSTAPGEKDIEKAVDKLVNSPKYDPDTTEIAFFGGSFTAIDREYMVSLLKAASVFVEKGIVSGIRISTRPDAIDENRLNILKHYHVTSIEIGAQSLNNSVLTANKRGHTEDDVIRSAGLIRDFGFELGIQMMTGLYTDTDESSIETAEKIIKLKPDTVRIYPTIVLKDTDLADLYYKNIYKPQSLESAVDLAVKLYKMFSKNRIKVIRLGLHSIETESYVAGPWHPAFSELCLSKIMLSDVLSRMSDKGKYILYVNKSDVSKMTGQKRSNIKALEDLGYMCKVKVNENLKSMEIIIEREV